MNYLAKYRYKDKYKENILDATAVFVQKWRMENEVCFHGLHKNSEKIFNTES